MKPICDVQQGGSAFCEWFSLNYARIRERLSLRSSLDEDCLHDAFLYVVSLRKPVSCGDFPAVFRRAYEAARRRQVSRSFQYVYPDPLFFDFLHEDDEETLGTEGARKDTRPSANRIMQYVKLHTTKRDYEAFSLYMLRNMPYSYIADYMGVSPANIRKRIDGVKQDIRHYFRKETA